MWQGRYYSCPLDLTHLWRALRYTELNPVRARMTMVAEAYHWPSAGAHCSVASPDVALDLDLWKKHWSADTWKQYLREPGAEADADAIRQCTHTGRPLGTADFVETLEKNVGRILSPQKGGRPAKIKDGKQESLSFD